MQKNKNTKDYRNHSLDGENFSKQDFTGVDFTGANLSESIFQACDFTGADFTGTCTTDTKFIESIFDAPSLLSLAASDCIFENCVCVDSTNIIPFDSVPIVISGLGAPITLIGHTIFVGTVARQYKAWLWFLASYTGTDIHGIPREMFEKALSILAFCAPQNPIPKDTYLRTVAHAQ